MKWHDLFDERDPDCQAKFRRRGAPVCIIMHTTGYGEGLKRLDRKHQDDAVVDARYAKRMDDILPHKGQFLVGRTGEVYAFSPWREFCSYHTGSSGRGRIREEMHFHPTWWSARHPGLSGALDLPAWHHGSPNRASVGIDLLAPRGGGLPVLVAQRVAAARLVAYVAREASIYIDSTTLVDHSSVDPFGRGGPNGAWDLPDAWNMPQFIREVQKASLEFGVDYERQVTFGPGAGN